MQKIITCTGFGGTGSSVISDYLSEYTSVRTLGNFEFTIAHDVDGISDLQHYIVDDFERNKTTEGIYRFRKLIKKVSKQYDSLLDNKFTPIAQQYIDDLISFKWEGFWQQHIIRSNPFKRYLFYTFPFYLQEKIFKKFSHSGYEFVAWQPKETMELAKGANIFFPKTRHFFEQLFELLNPDNKYSFIELDQLIPANNYERYLKYFNNLKIIQVDRDPRDLYLLNELFWKEGWIPSFNVDQFINWFRFLRNQDCCNKIDGCLLKIKLEDFIYNYDDTEKEIISFLGLDINDHILKKKVFNPELSKNNTRLWDRFKTREREVSKIASSLAEYCYNYE